MRKHPMMALIVAAAVEFTPVANAGLLSFAKRHPIMTAKLVARASAMHCNHVNTGADYLGEGKQKQCLTGSVPSPRIGESGEANNVEKSASELAKDRRQLVRNLSHAAVANGEPPEPPEGCEAHHIVPIAENRKGLSEYAQQARDSISGCVDINSAENGVYLPSRKDGTSQCPGKYHKTLHNADYYFEISERLRIARAKRGCQGVKDELLNIKNKLSGGG